MTVPNCKLCSSRHWPYQDHSVVEVPEYVREMARGVTGGSSAAEVGKAAAPVAVTEVPKTEASAVEPSSVKTCNACNKPLHNRGKVCNACRQKAYRKRVHEGVHGEQTIS